MNIPAPINDEYEEVLDTKKAFFQDSKKRKKAITLFVVIILIWSFLCFKFLPKTIWLSQSGFFTFAIPWFIAIWYFSSIYAKIRKAFWKQLALKYKWKYTPTKNITEEKALIFGKGYSKKAQNSIGGNYNNLPLYIFEYQYTVPGGKNSHTYYFTVFEVKFTGTFPHLYLNYKNDLYSNSPLMFSSFAKISLPQEFANKFKLYVPKEYEMEALQIFTPDIFALLLDLKWNHDMEFVDGELVIYSGKQFNTFIELDTELNKIKKFIEVLSPLLNRFKLTQIGDISPLLRK